MTSVLHLLQQWYFDRCDGDWEHQHGIDITRHQSSWSVEVSPDDLAVSKHAKFKNNVRVFETSVNLEIVECRAKTTANLDLFEERFRATATSLNAAIGAMLAQEVPIKSLSEDPICAFLDRWCTQYENAEDAVLIENLDNPGWRLHLRLDGSPKEGFKVDSPIAPDGDDWAVVWAAGKHIEGACGPLNFVQMLSSVQSVLMQ